MIHKDKKPFAYSASSNKEMIEEGEPHSKGWGIIVAILLLFQAALAVLYPFAMYLFYVHRFELDFIGGLLFFSLVALVINAVMRFLWPDASSMDEDIPDIDPELKDIAQKFMYMLHAEDITTSGVSYEPAEGGLIEVDCGVDYEYGEAVREDINQIAILFCSVIDRSPYPVNRADFTVETSDDVVIDFQIESEWCRKVLSGGLPSDEYLQKVDQTVSEESPDEVTLESVY